MSPCVFLATSLSVLHTSICQMRQAILQDPYRRVPGQGRGQLGHADVHNEWYVAVVATPSAISGARTAAVLSSSWATGRGGELSMSSSGMPTTLTPSTSTVLASVLTAESASCASTSEAPNKSMIELSRSRLRRVALRTSICLMRQAVGPGSVSACYWPGSRPAWLRRRAQ